MQDHIEILQNLNESKAEIIRLIADLRDEAVKRAKAEARYEKQLGTTCEEFAKLKNMAANLIEKTARASCAQLLEERNGAIYQHEDTRLALKAWLSVASTCQTELKVTEQAITRIPGMENQ